MTHQTLSFLFSFLTYVGLTPIHAQVSPLGNAHAPKGGTFVMGRSEEPVSLNPIVSDGHSSCDIQFHVIEPLLNLDSETNSWIPALADHWRILRDQQTYEFHLRRDATFSDGVPVTSADVKFSFDVLFDPAFPTAHMRPYYEGIRNVEIIDRQTVRFHAKSSYFLNFLTSAGLPIVPKHIYADPSKGPRLHRTVIGSGPYIVEDWQSGTRIILSRNPNWWGRQDRTYAGAYNANRVIFKFIANENSALEMIKRGELDYLPLTAAGYYKQAVGPAWGRDAFKVKFINAYPKMSEQVWWNLDRPILRDARVREALAHLLDRKFIVKKFDFATTIASTGPWYPQSDYADPKFTAPSFDPALARQILSEAGWRLTNGRLQKNIGGVDVPLSLTILISGHNSERYLSVLQQDAKTIGVDLHLKYVDANLLYPILERRDFDAVQTSGGGGLVDFDPKPTWHSASAGQNGANLSGFRDAHVDRLIEKARNTPARGARRPLMREIFARIARAYPALFVFNENESFYAVSSRVGRPRDTFRYDVGTKYWWIKASEARLVRLRR